MCIHTQPGKVGRNRRIPKREREREKEYLVGNDLHNNPTSPSLPFPSIPFPSYPMPLPDGKEDFGFYHTFLKIGTVGINLPSKDHGMSGEVPNLGMEYFSRGKGRGGMLKS